MRNTWRVFTVLAALLIGSVIGDTAAAQSARPDPERRPSPPPATPESSPIRTSGLRFISSEMNFSGKVVKHTPYSAETLTESTQTLSNGVKLTRRTIGMVYRDDEGRTRRELPLTMAGPFATGDELPRLIFINDPVAGTSSTVIPETDTTRTRVLPPAGNEAPPETEALPEPGRTESLGTRMIEGFEAEGTRTIISIPAGRIGNDLPLEIVHERWYSPELQAILLSRHSDPRWGETVYKLLNINRHTPDRSLFIPPPRSAPQGKKARPKP